MRTSSSLATLMTGRPQLFSKINERLKTHTKPVPRLNLLRLIKTMYEASPLSGRRRITSTPELAFTINSLAQNDSALLVRELAKELSALFALSLKKDAGVSTNLQRSSTSAGFSHSPRHPGTPAPDSSQRIQRVSGGPTSSSGRLPHRDSGGLPRSSTSTYLRPRARKASSSSGLAEIP